MKLIDLISKRLIGSIGSINLYNFTIFILYEFTIATPLVFSTWNVGITSYLYVH